MYKCGNKCRYYRVIRKGGKFKGFCDFNGLFFEEIKKEEMIERMENCKDYKPLINSTAEE